MATYADVIAQARSLLQDLVAPYRYTDTELLVGANDAVKTIRKLRPDTFIGNFSAPLVDAGLADTFPLGDEYKMVVRDYIVAHGNLRESEDAAASRAEIFIALFKEGMMAL